MVAVVFSPPKGVHPGDDAAEGADALHEAFAVGHRFGSRTRGDCATSPAVTTSGLPKWSNFILMLSMRLGSLGWTRLRLCCHSILHNSCVRKRLQGVTLEERWSGRTGAL